MDSRAKALIEALGMDSDPTLSDTQNLIRASVEYDKLAEQEHSSGKVWGRLKGQDGGFQCTEQTFRNAAAELRAMLPKEKTQLEKDVEILESWNECCAPAPSCVMARTILHILEQLKRQGKE